MQHDSLPPDVSSVDLQIVFNDDMLVLKGIDEPSVSQTGYYRDAMGNAHYTLHISPVTKDSVLATLHLFAYQTRANSTTIYLDSIQIHSSDSAVAPDCIATLSLASSEFSIQYDCNGPLLSEVLNGTPITFSVEPNPATEIAYIRYSLALSSPVSTTILIEDALGRIAESKQVELMPGNGNSLSLDLAQLPSGVYSVRIVHSGEAKTARIVKE